MKARSGLFAMLAIPLSLGQWTEISIPGRKMPSAGFQDGVLVLTTKSTAGGFAFLLAKSEASSHSGAKVSWTWAVERSPISKYEFPLAKKQDDFALRVGFLFEAGAAEMRVPPSIKKQLKERGARLSYVLFYNAVPGLTHTQRCELSPYNDHVVNCFLPANSQPTPVTVTPQADLKNALSSLGQKSVSNEPLLLGLWIFADSDNARTSSAGTLKDLRIETKKGDVDGANTQ